MHIFKEIRICLPEIFVSPSEALNALEKQTSRVGDLGPSLKPTYSDLKYDVESIGEGFGAIRKVPRAIATKTVF